MEKRGYMWFIVVMAAPVAAVYLLRPLFDPDFYWHLKTGQWIWEHKVLPVTDPFGVQPLPPPSLQSAFTLRAYWLWQLILYAFYSGAGMTGIVILRFLLAALVLAICSRWANLRNGSVVAVLALGCIEILEHFFPERPQFISFIFFGVLLGILFEFSAQKREWRLTELLVPLSLLMMLWANMHGGYLAGIGTLVLFAVLEGVKFLHPSLRPLTPGNYRILLCSTTAALLSSQINPARLPDFTTIAAFIRVAGPMQVREGLSLTQFLSLGFDYTSAFYLLSMLLTGAVLVISRQRTNLTWIGILGATGFLGFLYFRHAPLMLVAATMFLMKYFEEEAGAVVGKVTVLLMLAGIIVCGIRDEIPRVRESLNRGWVPASIYPVHAADFLSSNGSPGENIFSIDYWGSYLIWRLGPAQKLFEDGRHLDIERTREFIAAYTDTGDQLPGVPQQPVWKRVFASYNIQTAVLPLYGESGQMPRLTQAIGMDPGWDLVFSDGLAAVFRRKP